MKTPNDNKIALGCDSISINALCVLIKYHAFLTVTDRIFSQFCDHISQRVHANVITELSNNASQTAEEFCNKFDSHFKVEIETVYEIAFLNREIQSAVMILIKEAISRLKIDPSTDLTLINHIVLMMVDDINSQMKYCYQQHS